MNKAVVYQSVPHTTQTPSTRTKLLLNTASLKMKMAMSGMRAVDVIALSTSKTSRLNTNTKSSRLKQEWTVGITAKLALKIPRPKKVMALILHLFNRKPRLLQPKRDL
jgi:hypothetical protein